jgi:DEAD/DEAH box helicase domain-containing protein
VSDTLALAYERVNTCECESGCADCVASPTCKQGNIVSSKIGALVVLGGILNIIVDEDRLPPIRGAIPPEVIEYGTIVEAPGVGAVEGIEVEQGLEH